MGSREISPVERLWSGCPGVSNRFKAHLRCAAALDCLRWKARPGLEYELELQKVDPIFLLPELMLGFLRQPTLPSRRPTRNGSRQPPSSSGWQSRAPASCIRIRRWGIPDTDALLEQLVDFSEGAGLHFGEQEVEEDCRFVISWPRCCVSQVRPT